MIEYLKLSESHKTEEIFTEGIGYGGRVSTYLKPPYLKWVVEKKGIEEGRKIFQAAEFQHPPCLKLYKTMCDLESDEKNFSPSHIRKCHDLACLYFGRDNPSKRTFFFNSREFYKQMVKSYLLEI